MNNYLDVGISIERTRRRKPMNTTSKREEHRTQERKEPSVERKEKTSDVYKKRDDRRTKGKCPSKLDGNNQRMYSDEERRCPPPNKCLKRGFASPSRIAGTWSEKKHLFFYFIRFLEEN